MQSPIVPEVRAECKRLGIPFEVVRDAKRAMEEQDRQARERQNEVRQVAWSEATTRGCWPFWRFGFRARWGRKYDERDCTAIPGYDEIHQIVAGQFPEYDGTDGEHKLFEFLFSPYEPFTPPRDLWWRALELVQHQSGERDWQSESEPSYCEQEF